MIRTEALSRRANALGMLRIEFAACLLWVVSAVIGPAQAQPEDGQKFTDWTVRCEQPDPNGPEVCYLLQVITREGSQAAVSVAVGYLDQQRPAVVFTFPLGIFLPPGASFSIDNGERASFAIQQCHPNGCVGGVPLSEALIAQMQKGRQAEITVYDADGGEVPIPVSLLGFTAGFNSLR